jgi:hypothetical protein
LHLFTQDIKIKAEKQNKFIIKGMVVFGNSKILFFDLTKVVIKIILWYLLLTVYDN